MRVERYRGQHGEVIAIDTLRFTHRGPLRRLAGRWVSTRWTVLEPSNEADNTIAAAHARSVAEWMRAMATYQVPAQNMLVADRAGTIAIRSTGRFPIRPGDGRGNVLRDGSTSASDWRGAWPVAEYPQAVRPAQGYLASANQQPVDPAVAPRYLGASWPAPWRAMRINALLRADGAVTPDEMRRFQTDPGSARADLFVPAFLAAARARPGDSAAARAAALLAQWDRRYTRDNQRAVLFEAAMRELSLALWDEMRGPGDGEERGPVPSDVIAAELLADSTSAWWDDRRTAGATERRDDILRRSLAAALRAVTRAYGAPDAGGWRWSRVRHANIHHLLRLDAFSALDIPVQGGPGTLSPSSGSGTHGASWRMVVELGPELHAWGTYPGGQSGNPASRRYADRLPKWTAGELDSLRVPRRPEELGGRLVSTLTLAPAHR
jgi:penicillin amidase